jgi:hypothetical protein
VTQEGERNQRNRTQEVKEADPKYDSNLKGSGRTVESKKEAAGSTMASRQHKRSFSKIDQR